MKKSLNKIKFKYRIWLILFLCIIAGAINALGVKLFMKSLNLVPLGSTGTSVVFEKLLKVFFNVKIPYYYFYFLLNISICIWSYYKLSKSLVYKSILYVMSFTIVSTIIPEYVITKDKFVNIMTGGSLNAISNIIVLYVGGTSAGYTLIGLFVSKKVKKSVVGATNTLGDIVDMSIMIFFNGVENIIMSILASVVCLLIVDRFHSQSNYISLFIVTKNPTLFITYASQKLKRSATIINSTGSYSLEKNKTVMLTISKQNFGLVKKELMAIDPKAYITIYNVNQIIGNMKSKVGKSSI